jgi:predicted phosphodiesterase
MEQVLIKNAAKGEYIKRKADSKIIYIKGNYDRASRSYCCTDVNDICRNIYIKVNKKVFVAFDY